jgi:deoxyribodipyrimidine photo-lyase
MPLVDALMREMNETGFMPNRGRMVVACYLTMDIKQDWRFGAHYFEEKLIDHDVQSNYGGWCSSAGIGPGRVLVFNSLLQSTKFDPNGEYIRKWCPEL